MRARIVYQALRALLKRKQMNDKRRIRMYLMQEKEETQL